jgi:hypothetical protein
MSDPELLEQLHSLEKIYRGKKFIIRENTRLVSNIRSFINQNCQHHQHMKMFGDDGHTYGHYYKCLICFADLGMRIPTIFDTEICAEIDHKNNLHKKLSAEIKTCADSVVDIETQIYLLQKNFSEEICTHTNTYEIFYVDQFKYSRCIECETLIE